MADASITYVSMSYNKDATRHKFNGSTEGGEREVELVCHRTLVY